MVAGSPGSQPHLSAIPPDEVVSVFIGSPPPWLDVRWNRLMSSTAGSFPNVDFTRFPVPGFHSAVKVGDAGVSPSSLEQAGIHWLYPETRISWMREPEVWSA